VSEADYRSWAVENAGLEIDVLIPVEPGVTRDDIAVQLSEVFGSSAELGLAKIEIEITAYAPDDYYELARLHATNKYVFDNNYDQTIKIEFIVSHSWYPQ
ncbi:MAG: hypothetical protein LBK42_00065, partial [Propionibacteriaceae bacterium]|nr:hypothetical protein [Propionibacteriaceae bacterium]